MPPAIFELIEKSLVQAGEAIKPTNSAVGVDIELGALLLSFVSNIFQHHKEKMKAA